MRKEVLLVAFAIIINGNLQAQKNTTSFHSINSGSFLVGESHGWGFQTINGLAYKALFSGIGLGADYYHYNSYPLFFDQRIYFGKRLNFFGYGDLGYNFSAAKNKPGKEVDYYNSYHFSGGMYAGFGLGYKCALTPRSFLTFSAGLSYKRIDNKVTIVYECLVAPCPVDYQHYQYDNGRVDLRAGIDF